MLVVVAIVALLVGISVPALTSGVDTLRLRSGTDIPVIYGLLWHVFQNGWEDKEFIRQRVYEGKRFREIAADLHCPLNTALARMHEGLKRLRLLWERGHV